MSILAIEHTVHVLKRILKGGKRTDYWQCADPHCTFVRHKDYLLGKAALCPYCNKDFVITRLMLKKQGVLHCRNCSIGPRSVKQNPLEALERAVGQLLEEANVGGIASKLEKSDEDIL